MAAEDHPMSVGKSSSLAPCPRKERRQEMVKLGVNENRTLFWPPNVWNVAASGSPFPIHTTNMMHGLSVNQWLPCSKVC